MSIRLFETGGFTILAGNLDEAKKVFKKDRKKLKRDILEKFLEEMKEVDYEKSFTYFPVEEIKEKHKDYIYDYRWGVGKLDKEPYIASLPLKYAFEYESYHVKFRDYTNPSVLPWISYS